MKHPYSIVGSNGKMPNILLVTILGGQYARVGGLNSVYHRAEGESNIDFWHRAVANVTLMLSPMRGHPKQHVVIIRCIYNTDSFEEAPPFPEELFDQ